jgi:hypothetical protein
MTRAIADDANEAARQFAKDLIDREFGGNVAKAARVIGVSKAGLGAFVRGAKGAGLGLLRAIAKHSRVSVDAITGGDVVELLTPERGALQPPTEITPALPLDAPLYAHPAWRFFLSDVVDANGGDLDDDAAALAGMLPIGGIVGPMSTMVALSAYQLASALLKSIRGGARMAEGRGDTRLRDAFEGWSFRVQRELDIARETMGIAEYADMAREGYEMKLAREMPDLPIIHMNMDGTETHTTAAAEADGEPGEVRPSTLFATTSDERPRSKKK